MQSAIAVSHWYLNEHKRNFDENDGATRGVRDAWLVLKHLYIRYWMKGNMQALYNDVLNGGPPSIREGVRYLDPAMDHLVNKQYVHIGPRGRTKVIYLNSSLFRELTPDLFFEPMPEDFSRPSTHVLLYPAPRLEDSSLAFRNFGLVSKPTRI